MSSDMLTISNATFETGAVSISFVLPDLDSVKSTLASLEAKIDSLATQEGQAISTQLMNQGVIMSVLTDLQAAEASLGQAVAGVGASVQAGVDLIKQLQSGSVANADVEAVVAQMTQAAADANAAAAALNAAVMPVVTPPPTP